MLFGFAGADTLEGAGGDNLLDGEGPQFFTPEADVLIGGTGVDAVSYASHFNPVTADIDDIADDGVAGENDRVRTSVENLFGVALQRHPERNRDANIVDGGQSPAPTSSTGSAGRTSSPAAFGFDTSTATAATTNPQPRRVRRHRRLRSEHRFGRGRRGDTLANCENVFNPRPLVAPRRGLGRGAQAALEGSEASPGARDRGGGEDPVAAGGETNSAPGRCAR